MNVCLLTGKSGSFIKSHIIPQGLQAKPALSGAMLNLGGKYGPGIARTSWYDPNIVTIDGEKILALYDDAATKILRRHRLVWSGWGPMQKLAVANYDKIPNTPYGLRKIENIEIGPLRLFFLSLLWRAAISEMDEFKEIALSKKDLRELTRMVRDGSDDAAHNFPVSLMQIHEMGEKQNQTPFLIKKSIPSLDGKTPEVIFPMFRFYFDGLMVHIGTKSNDKENFDGMGPMALGFAKDLSLPTVELEASFQIENERLVLLDAMRSHPEKVRRHFEMMEERRRKAGLSS